MTIPGDTSPIFGAKENSGTEMQIVHQADPATSNRPPTTGDPLLQLQKQLAVQAEEIAAARKASQALVDGQAGGKKREDGLDVDPEGALIRAKLDPKTGRPRRPASQIAKESGLVMVPAGTIITLRTITRIQTELGGTCLAVIDSDVLSAQYDAVAIPKGSKVLGAVQGVAGQAQDRASVIFRQIVDLNGDQIQLLVPEPATDQIGAAGVSGDVDHHWGTQFGAAFAWGIISGLAGSGSVPAANPSSNFGSVVQGNVSSSFGQVGQNYLSQAMNIKPTMEVAENTMMRVILGNPIYIRAWQVKRPF
jgi:type IV secretion system protein VirB10